jgi:hypothetical protein
MKRPAIEQTEVQFMHAVIELAKLTGWLVFHAKPAQVRPGRWLTAFDGDPGFPDLMLVSRRGLGALFAELKTSTGKLTAGQIDWLAELAAAGVEAHVWRPADMPEITRRLMGGTE